MSRILVLGGGVCGLAAGLLLARDGHQVRLLERDPAPAPDAAEAAWSDWERRGVPHFRQAHGLHPPARHILEAELPDVAAALLADGARIGDPLDQLPPGIADRERRPGDDRFRALHVRRPVFEGALARAADAQPGLVVRRGVTVTGLVTRGLNGSAHVAGVETADGRVYTADLVVDAMGRGSRLPGLLARAGIASGPDELVGSRFLYYTRYFRGEEPVLRAPRLTAVGSFSILTLPADNGTWAVTLFGAADDRPLKRLRDPDAFTAVVRACPRHAHWLEGRPITGVLPMAGVTDRRRPAAAPVAGLLSVADAWACTNPTMGRGITMGLMHVRLLRDVVRAHGGEPRVLAAAWTERTEETLGPWFGASLENDRARLAEMEACREGRVPEPPADPAAKLRAALGPAMARDADAFRAGLEIIGCLATPQEVFARPGLAGRVLALAAEAGPPPPPGPDRERLLQLVG